VTLEQPGNDSFKSAAKKARVRGCYTD
jgi:hypothetical protein